MFDLPCRSSRWIGAVVAGSLGALCISHSASGGAIVSDAFSGIHGGSIDQRTPDTDNLPGSTWTMLPFGSFGGAYISTQYGGNPSPVAWLRNDGNSTGGIAISIADAGNYLKPSKFTISADIAFDGSAATNAGVGFYSALPTEATSGDTILTHFTGLQLQWWNTLGELQLVVNGATVGSPIAYTGTFAPTAYHTLSYTVDTTTGAISNVDLQGSTSSYNFDTSGFSNTATAYAAAATTYTWGRDHWMAFDNFSVSAVPEPTSIALLGLGGGFLMVRRREKHR